MCFDTTKFPSRDLYKLIKHIIQSKKIASIENIDMLKKILNEYIEENCYNEFIKIIKYDKCSIIYTTPVLFNINYQDECIDKIMHQFKSCVVDNDTCLPITYVDRHIDYSTESGSYYTKIDSKLQIDYLKNVDKVKFYKNYSGEYVVLFYDNEKWCVLHNNTVSDLYDEDSLIPNLLANMLMDKIDLDEINKTYSHHFVMMHYRLGKCISNSEWDSEYRELLHVKSEEKFTLNRFDVNLSNKIIPNKRVYLSCKDELLVGLESVSNEMSVSGNIPYRGYLLEYEDEHDRFLVNFDVEIYSRINSKLEPYKNINRAFLVLYQNDECGKVLSYVINNPTSVVKRINLSIKTLSKEILDIYFLTRNKKNSQLYNILSKNTKNILFNIHNIFINKKMHNSDIKMPVNISNVYCYLKKGLTGEELIHLYFDRDELSKKIKSNKSLDEYKNIINDSCIHTIMQTKLMR